MRVDFHWHVPHTQNDKHQDLPASGITNGFVWPYLQSHLLNQGMTPQQFDAYAFFNPLHLYHL